MAGERSSRARVYDSGRTCVMGKKKPNTKTGRAKARGGDLTQVGRELSEEIRERVEAATVTMVREGGQGVLIKGYYILTAAHCVRWSGTGTMATEENAFTEVVQTSDNSEIVLNVFAVDLVADIAVLGPCTWQQSADDAKAFETFAGPTEGIP